MLSLFKIRGFTPFILILLINATVDIAHKITIQNVLLKSFEGDTLVTLVAIVNALILLPFILLFSPSGFLSDRFSKTSVVRYSALSAVVLTLLITLSYYQGWFYFAFGMTFLLAIQSAIYSPAKYGLIKELIQTQNLGMANGIVQAITIIAILMSSILFSVLFENLYQEGGDVSTILQTIAPLGWILVLLSVIESYLTFKLPIFEASDQKKKFSLHYYFTLRYFRVNFRHLRSDKNIWLSVIGLSIFWGLGQMIIAAFPAHYKMITGDDNAIIVQMVLAVSALGLVIGSTIAGKYSKLHIELGIVPLGALGIFVAVIMFAFATELNTMMLSSILFGLFGGLMIVPLNASIQYFAPKANLGTILAGNNFTQNVVMFTFLMLTVVAVQAGFNTVSLFLVSGFIALLATIYTIKKLPHLFTRILLVPILRTRYKLHVHGLENLPQSGGVLLLGNHISWIDWLVLQIASPRAIKYVMHKGIYNQWFLRWFLKLFNVIPIASASSKNAIAQIRERLDNGEVVALFPEGHISYNGQLGSFKRGFELALKESNHPVVPFYLHGLWGSTFSRADQHFKQLTRKGSRRHLHVAFGQALPSSATTDQVKQHVVNLSHQTWQKSIDTMAPLHHQWLTRAKANLFKRSIVDAIGTDLNNLKMITAVLLFANRLRYEKNRNIGVLLPSSAIGSIINMALLVVGKRAINLNYTLSEEAMATAINRAQISTVITSEKFMQKLITKGFDFTHTLEGKIVTVEGIGQTFTKFSRALALVQALLFPAFVLRLLYFAPTNKDETATILFSSGSEGTPKGIELTHKNLLANIKQVSALLNFQDNDVIVNSLPIFHSFGLTVTTLLPLCEGVPIVSMPDPTDATTLGKMSARYQATLMFGTSTFFRLYNRNKKLHPLMLRSIRMVVAGAEKLKPEIKQEFKNKFGLEIFEGYGATETSPVISVNMPDGIDIETMGIITGNKNGTVGQGLPGTIVKIVDPNSMEELATGEDGLIIVGGSQVMKGYLDDPDKTAEVISEIDGIRYYKTGDKGHIDEDGFITIVDRYSRFAKVGGEMISLGSVEEQLDRLFGDDVEMIAVALSDEKKGEQIALLVQSELSVETIKSTIKASDITPIMHPSTFIEVQTLPKLASGKSDFKGAVKVAKEWVDANR
jgi:acyl-[acyl-carrier-protein]-phospholipid O-acyltransferase/long-chain-fatty-acid--[acyl-carrier-protein] ligase